MKPHEITVGHLQFFTEDEGELAANGWVIKKKAIIFICAGSYRFGLAREFRAVDEEEEEESLFDGTHTHKKSIETLLALLA